MIDKNKINELAALQHAMQSGVKFDQESGSEDGSPKHLRVGVNTAMVDIGALAKLLIDKGVITEEEYFDANLKAMHNEVGRYEKRLSEKFGRNVVLG
jgi:hypothetical protein